MGARHESYASPRKRPLADGDGFGSRQLGSYLVVDGHWMPDPLATETVPNPFGGRNSILRVASSPEAAHLVEAATLPLKNANR